MKYDAQITPWIKSLKIGDEICDCRFKHLKIARIFNDHSPRMPWIIRNTIYHPAIPFAIFSVLDNLWAWICSVIGYEVCFDRTLTLEDGSQCSAVNCADPVDSHSIEDHNLVHVGV